MDLYNLCNTLIHINMQLIYAYIQLLMSRTRKGLGKVSDLSRCPTYPTCGTIIIKERTRRMA